MQVSDGNFIRLFQKGMQSPCSAEDKKAFLAILFKRLVRSDAVKKCYANELNVKPIDLKDPSSLSCKLVAEQTYDILFRDDFGPSDWDQEFVIMNLDIGVSSLVNRKLVGRYIEDKLRKQTEETAGAVFSLLNENSGADISSYNLYRLAFNHQSPFILEIVDKMLKSKRYPTLPNLHRLLVIDSEYTLDILNLMTPYNVVFTSSCLTYALKYSREPRQLAIIAFLLDRGAIPTEEHRDFAVRHCSRECVEKIEESLKAYSKSELIKDSLSDLLPKKSKPVQKWVRSIDEALTWQKESSLSELVYRVAQGERLNPNHLKILLSGPRSDTIHATKFTYELLRFFLICKIKPSEKVLKQLVNSNFPYLERVVYLNQLYGHSFEERMSDYIARSREKDKKQPSDEDPVLLALWAFLDSDKMKPLTEVEEIKKELKTPIQTILSEYTGQAPGLYEKILRSGIHPTLRLLDLYCNDKIGFFYTLLEYPHEPFDANSHNQDLFVEAIQSTNGEVVCKMAEKGFKVTPTEVLFAIDFQTEPTVEFLTKKLHKEYEQLKEKQEEGTSTSSFVMPMAFTSKKVRHIDEKDEFAVAIANPNAETKEELKRLIKSGKIPRKAHFDLLRKNPSVYTPELIQFLEKSGWNY